MPTRARRPLLWPRAAVFDCDGLLVDSGRCWRSAYEEVARDHGGSLAGVDVDALAGASVAGAAVRLGRELGAIVSEQELRRHLRAAFAADPPPILPGVHRIVNALGDRMPLAVASNAPRDVLMSVLERHRIGGSFRSIVSAEQTPAHKPAPDVYLEACLRLGVAPSDAIAFEDSPLGARAARAAGLFVVAVPSVRGATMPADLTFGRLDDPKLLRYLTLAPSPHAHKSSIDEHRIGDGRHA